MLAQLRRSERGTAIVEFAVIAPMLFFLVFGLIDFARALAYYNDLTQLAGQGARAAAVNRNPDGTSTPTATSIQSQLAANAANGELKNGIVVCITHASTTLPNYVTVKTKYRFPFLKLLKIGAGTFTLSATSTMLEEVQPVDSTGSQTYQTLKDQNGNACS
jgi:Flp pilus assembly protein TadG